jgi:hypothetical protein
MQIFKRVLCVGALCSASLISIISKAEENSPNVSVMNWVQQKADYIYSQIDFGKGQPLSKLVFRKAYTGFLNLKEAGKLASNTHIITVCDFSLSANDERLWIIDLNTSKVLYHTLVAHGQGTGEEFATQFSNIENSHQSSLGFYATGETYMGDNGYSLRLLGFDNGFNDAAMSRAIVMHGADYVSKSFIKNNQRLGRSWGCPAVPQAQAKGIINTIKNGSCLYIHHPNKAYHSRSVWLNRVPKMNHLGDEAFEPILAENINKVDKKTADVLDKPHGMSKSTNPKVDAVETINKIDETPAKPIPQGIKLMMGGQSGRL